VDSTRTSSNGRFSLTARGAGTYALHFTSAGYASVPSEGIAIAAGQTVDHRFAAADQVQPRRRRRVRPGESP
jgi:hypothetical protein